MLESTQLLKSYLNKALIEAGTDEAGRGCLAGPVVAAAVILPQDFKNSILRDSKKLNESQRQELSELIKSQALAHAISFVDNNKIDEINILNASILAMHNALDQLNIKPQYILVDGNRFKPFYEIPFSCIVKGDDKFMSIAAASVLAKVARDEYMLEQSIKHPEYCWQNNKGYPTVQHRKAIKEFGICSLHRKSFKLLDSQSQYLLFNKTDTDT